jgi:hypothetical protein
MNDLTIMKHPDYRTQAQLYGYPAEQDEVAALTRGLDPDIVKI